MNTDTNTYKNIVNSIEQITIRLNLLDTKINNLHTTVNIILNEKMSISKIETLKNKKGKKYEIQESNFSDNESTNTNDLINIKKNTQYRKRII